MSKEVKNKELLKPSKRTKRIYHKEWKREQIQVSKPNSKEKEKRESTRKPCGFILTLFVSIERTRKAKNPMEWKGKTKEENKSTTTNYDKESRFGEYIYRSKERKNGTYVIKEVDTIVKEES